MLLSEQTNFYRTNDSYSVRYSPCHKIVEYLFHFPQRHRLSSTYTDICSRLDRSTPDPAPVLQADIQTSADGADLRTVPWVAESQLTLSLTPGHYKVTPNGPGVDSRRYSILDLGQQYRRAGKIMLHRQVSKGGNRLNR